MAGCGHLLERLLVKTGARDLVLARGENRNLHPRVFAKLVFPYSSMPHWLETSLESNSSPLVFPISWQLLEKEKSNGLKRISNLDIVSLMHGWSDLSVGLRSERFQEHVIEKMLETASSEIFICPSLSKDNIFLPKASCVEEVSIWLDVNETNDSQDRNLRYKNLRNLVQLYL